MSSNRSNTHPSRNPLSAVVFDQRSKLRYILALGLTAITTVLLFPIRNQINLTIIILLYLLPVGLSSAFWGLEPGLLAATSSFLAQNYFFIPPYHTLAIQRPQDLLAIVVFLAVAIALGQLLNREQRNRARAAAREIEAIRLYELSTRLGGLLDENEIAEAITNQVLVTFQSQQVEIVVEPTRQRQQVSVRVRENPEEHQPQPELSSTPDQLIPLQSSQGLIGELSVWRRTQPFSASEERLLQTFASHGVLALERARLAQADRRARILEESDRLKSSLLSSVSHELRTPLATIKAAVTSLRAEDVSLDEEANAELLAVIEEETDLLNQLVGNLLNMARIEAGALNPQRRWQALSEIVTATLTHMRQQAQRRQFEIHIPEELPNVPVDYFQLEQVLTNLFSNSIKYSPEGTPILISAAEQQGAILVTVTNQGPPVPEEHLEHIFDKFFRITAAERVTGAGLGLSICKGIVEAHGGKIWAENLPEGFAFRFTLPLTWQPAQEKMAAPETMG